MFSISSEYTAVVAIDFGTTRSGYHFAFTANSEKIYSNENWIGAPPEGKTLTEVLIKRIDFSFVAFGYEARNQFVACENKDDYLYFSNFKMVLHNQGSAVRGTVKATNCNVSIPTLLLISICLRAIKERALKQLNRSHTVGIADSKIQWVVTVPAIWDIAARQVMTNAAEKAGISPGNIIIALEPEAAVLSCLEKENEAESKLDVGGNDFMVVDAGGGTIDITVHHKNADDTLTELHSPSGGTWGSSFINKQFEELLEDVFGNTLISKIKNSEEWYNIMDSFEGAKIKFTAEHPIANVDVNSIIPEVVEDKTFKIQIDNYNATKGTKLVLNRGMLRLASVMPVLMGPIISNIVNHISLLLKKPALRTVRYLFLVGGFAESPMLREQIEKVFGRTLKVVTPPRPGIAVVNGAVRFGLDPGAISDRIMTQTIGMISGVAWDDFMHAGRTQAIDDAGRRFCADSVSCFVLVDEKIGMHQQVAKECVPLLREQTQLQVTLYGSSKPTISYFTDAGAKLIGYLVLDIPDKNMDWQRIVDVVMKFGGTTFSVTATYRRTGQSVNAKFNFVLDETPAIERLYI